MKKCSKSLNQLLYRYNIFGMVWLELKVQLYLDTEQGWNKDG